ncbi:E3 ubiquitin-protein ligase pub1 [Umbelopsis sp. WA50703]
MSMNEGCKALYVGNLDSRVTDYMLYEIFSVVGQVDNVKIIMDRNYQHGGMNYGFVEFVDHLSAEQALLAMNGRKIFTSEIRVNWAVQGATQKEDTSNHFHIFVGDLSPEVDDTILTKAFSAFGTMSDARVMWDQNTGKSRGFGFVSFREKADAEQAISTMNGEWLGSRAIRCNWANQKAAGVSGGSPAQSLSYESVLAQTPPHQTTVYIGNLPHGFQQHDLAPYFQPYGYVSDIRMQAERGFAFVTLDSHENAAHAIVALNGADIGGRPARLSWGKDRAAGGGGAAYGAGAYGYGGGGGGGGYHQASPAAWHQPQAYAQAPAAAHGQAANGQWDQYYQQYYGHQGGYQ